MLSETPSPGAGQSTPTKCPSEGRSLQRSSRIGRGKTSQDKLTWASGANDQIPCSVSSSSACGCCLQDREKVPPRMFRNGSAMCAQPAVAVFLGLNNPAVQAFHQYFQSLFSRAVPSVPPVASPLMSTVTRPPAHAGKLSDSDFSTCS